MSGESLELKAARAKATTLTTKLIKYMTFKELCALNIVNKHVLERVEEEHGINR